MRRKIILKATELFLSLGFKSVTMDDLAQSMAISKKTIYQYFQNKDQLISSCVESVQNKIVKDFKDIRRASSNPIIELFQIKKIAMQILGSTKNAPQFQLQKFYPEIYEKIKSREFDLVSTQIKESLKQGVDLGYFRSEINMDFITRIYLNSMQAIRDIELFPIEEFKIEELFENYLEYHLRAIVTKKGLDLLNRIYNTSEK
tara:strand:- start:4722 stop:5327 length:606 start_codon:yes stop_codon:yes gene_type:complete